MLSVITSLKDPDPELLWERVLFYDQLVDAGVNFEWVVQDCNSPPRTLAQLRSRYYVRLESIQDNGIYHAWNKALKRCIGSNVTFLGLDDEPDLEWLQFAARRKLRGNSAVSCDVVMADERGRFLGVRDNPGAGTLDLGAGPYVHPGMVFSADIYRGKTFNERYQIISDGLFYRRLEKLHVIEKFSRPGVVMRIGGVSNSSENARRRFYEFIRAIYCGDIEGDLWVFMKMLSRHTPAYLLSLSPSLYKKVQKLRWSATN